MREFMEVSNREKREREKKEDKKKEKKIMLRVSLLDESATNGKEIH